jgi:hypothetical protein
MKQENPIKPAIHARLDKQVEALKDVEKSNRGIEKDIFEGTERDREPDLSPVE